MPSAVYDAVSYGMRYWFIFVIGMMLLLMISISVFEYRQHKYVMGQIGSYVGYLEIVYGPEDALGARVGLTHDNKIGSSKNADIVIDDPSVNKSHASIYMQKGRLLIAPLGGSELKINNRRAVKRHEIFSGDVITLGKVEAQVFIKPVGEEEDDV